MCSKCCILKGGWCPSTSTKLYYLYNKYLVMMIYVIKWSKGSCIFPIRTLYDGRFYLHNSCFSVFMNYMFVRHGQEHRQGTFTSIIARALQIWWMLMICLYLWMDIYGYESWKIILHAQLQNRIHKSQDKKRITDSKRISSGM